MVTRRKAKSGPGSANLPQVRVRMYRHGLGDCLLLTFDPEGTPRHILLDCGVITGSSSAGLKQAVADIRKTTGDHLDLLVVTHEHGDHVSGFHSFRKEFEKIDVGNVWLAWTENPKEDLAQRLKRYENDLGQALCSASVALSALSAKGPAEGPNGLQAARTGEAIRAVLGFMADPEALGAGKFAKTSNAAMEFVRLGFGKEAQYLSPGQEKGLIEPEWLPGFRFYVLGPPKSAEALKNLSESDLYHVVSGLKAAGAVPGGASGSAESEAEDGMPFGRRFGLRMDDPLMASAMERYEAEPFRRVDADWLQAASDLALQLDSITNNTSLVLAIERIGDGKVMLFAADAQTGNWASWHSPELKWKVRNGGEDQEVEAKDLLGRTVFYKAGHHASHNGTAMGKGLELMGNEELVSFIPVDRAVALKKEWDMPAPPLYRRLLERCQGRVLRSDLGWAEDAAEAGDKAVEKGLRGIATAQEWGRWKETQGKAPVTAEGLYFDYWLK